MTNKFYPREEECESFLREVDLEKATEMLFSLCEEAGEREIYFPPMSSPIQQQAVRDCQAYGYKIHCMTSKYAFEMARKISVAKNKAA